MFLIWFPTVSMEELSKILTDTAHTPALKLRCFSLVLEPEVLRCFSLVLEPEVNPVGVGMCRVLWLLCGLSKEILQFQC